MSMEIRPVDSRFAYQLICQWTEWIRYPDFKWHNFDFVNLAIEFDDLFGNFEVSVALLGFTGWFQFRVRKPNSEGSRILRDCERTMEHFRQIADDAEEAA